MKKYDLRLLIIIILFWICWISLFISLSSNKEPQPIGCEKQVEELQIEYQARQSTYEMDYRTCEIRLQEALEMNEYLKKRIKGFTE